MYDDTGQSTMGDTAAGSGDPPSWSANGTGVAQAPEAPKTDGAEFVDELLKAMKATAASQRARLNEDTDRRRAELLATINARRDVEAARIRLLADDDRRSIESWAEEEHRRIREEQTRRIESLHRNLEASLAEHGSRIDREIERLEAAIGSYRTEVESFFGSLEDETDPVAIAQSASRRPTFPALDSLGSDTVQRATTADPEPAAALSTESAVEPPADVADATVRYATAPAVSAYAVTSQPVADSPATEAISSDVAADDGATAVDAGVGEAVMAADAAQSAPVEATESPETVALTEHEPEPVATIEPEPVAIPEPVATIEPVAMTEPEVSIPAEATSRVEAAPAPFEPAIAESFEAAPALDTTETVELIGSAEDVNVPEPAETTEPVVAQATNGTYPIEIDTSPETTGIGVMEPLSQSKLAEAWAAWNRSTAAADAAAEAARAAEQAEGDAATEAENEVEAAKPAGAYVEPVTAGAPEQRSGPFSSGPGFARMSWLRRDKGENGN